MQWGEREDAEGRMRVIGFGMRYRTTEFAPQRLERRRDFQSGPDPDVVAVESLWLFCFGKGMEQQGNGRRFGTTYLH